MNDLTPNPQPGQPAARPYAVATSSEADAGVNKIIYDLHGASAIARGIWALAYDTDLVETNPHIMDITHLAEQLRIRLDELAERLGNI